MTERKPLDALAGNAMLLLCLIWGTQQVAIKLAAPDMSPLLQVGLRSGLSALLTLGLVLREGALVDLFGPYLRHGLAVGALFGLEFVCVGEGLRLSSASHVTIFLYTAPVFAALWLGLLHRSERLRPVQWLGMALAFGGILLAFADSGASDAAAYPHMLLGDALALAGGLAWAATMVLVRAGRLADAPASITLLYQLLGALVMACAMAFLLGESTVHLTLRLAAAMAYQTLIVAFLSYLAWFALLRHYLASRLGILSFLTPVFGVLSGIAVLGERLGPAFIAGALLILAGMLVVALPDLVAPRAPARPGARSGH
ncbi:MAG TPA: DMT family transporter [Novosphingobium sp.]|nr:DMT family transporter [Novosphingobium sp.]